MSTISTGIGLMSGINIDEMVASLMALQQRPVIHLQERVGTLVNRRAAFLQISAQLLSVRNAAARLADADFFRSAQATSSNESAILATTADGAAFGQYTFTVRNLASSHQLISAGFASRDTTPVGAGTLTIETADALLNRPTSLSMLNGGSGVRAGRISITDRAGGIAEIDLRTVSTVDDVLQAINSQVEANVSARVEGDHLVIEDQTGLPSGSLVVSEVGGGHTAADLGLLAGDVDGVITGNNLVALTGVTRLRSLNDGNGVRVLPAQQDFRVSLADGSAFEVDLSGRLAIEYRDNNDGTFTDLSTPLSLLNRGTGVTLGTISVTNRAGVQVEIDLSSAQTIRDITTAPEWEGLDITLAVSGSHLFITDNSTGDGSTLIEDVDATTAADLGIADSSSSETMTGEDVFFVETVGDVMRIINAHADNADGNGSTKLIASISTDGPSLTLTDTTTGGAALRVDALNGSQAAYDLGIVGGTPGDTIESRRLLAGLNTTLLRSLNGGSGVSQRLTTETQLSALHRGGGVPAGEIRITLRDGTQVDVDLSSAVTIGDVKTAIEAASTDLTVELSGGHIEITDASIPEGETPVSDLIIEDTGGTQTAEALGIDGSTGAGSLIGRDIFADAGSIQLTDRDGVTATVDLSNAQTLAEVIAAINAASTSITASISPSGLGLELTDTSGGSGSLMIEDLPGSTAAADLNIAFSGAQDVVSSGNLQRQYVSAATWLADFNGGVPAGSFLITDSSGASAVVDLTQGDEVTLQDVIDEINSRGLDVVARMNDTGDGLLLTDTAGGTGRLEVTEEGGTTAAALGILGRAAEGAGTIDGSLETRIVVGSGDTLDDLLAELRENDGRLNATIINDGTGNRPYRLNLTSATTGHNGRLVIDVGTTGLTFETLTEARDATVLFGGPDADSPLVLTSSTNTLNGVVPGVRLDLVGPSDDPVTITVSRNIDSIAGDLSSLVTAFNNAVSQIDSLSRFDTETETRGILTGDFTARSIRQRLVGMVNRSIDGLPPTMNRLSQAGVTISGGTSLQFNRQAFEDALARDPDAVAELFAHEEVDGEGETVVTGFGGIIQQGVDWLTDSETGLIPLREESIRGSERLLNERIDQLNILLGRRREGLYAQFYTMESALAQLQAQQSALQNLQMLSV